MHTQTRPYIHVHPAIYALTDTHAHTTTHTPHPGVGVFAPSHGS